MVAASADHTQISGVSGTADYRRRLGLMGVSAIVVSAAIITYFNSVFNLGDMAPFYSTVELASITLVPYMISAVVAAVTAVGIITIWPWIKMPQGVQMIEQRLREMSAGDLSTKVKLHDTNDLMLRLARELNGTVGELSNALARWKLLDRAQWDYLETIRIATEKGDLEEVRRNVVLVQKNFDKIGELHERLVT